MFIKKKENTIKSIGKMSKRLGVSILTAFIPQEDRMRCNFTGLQLNKIGRQVQNAISNMLQGEYKEEDAELILRGFPKGSLTATMVSYVKRGFFEGVDRGAVGENIMLMLKMATESVVSDSRATATETQNADR